MICLDSDCIIDFLKGRSEAIDIIDKYKDNLATTELNLFEVYFGIHNKKVLNITEEKSADMLFESLLVLPFDNGCGKESSMIMAKLMKEGKMINQNDVLIAGILKKNNINSFITRNEKHFSNIKGLNVVTY